MSCNYDSCVKCLQVSLYIQDILEGKIKKANSSGPKTFEIDYSLKNLLDAFSRNLCWFMGQSAYKLITIKDEKKVKVEGASKEDELEQIILQSNLLAGGVEPRLVSKLFTADGLKMIDDL
jgi:hypothetical protein